MINTLDLFSGIGGFSYGLKQTGGFRTVAYCEIEEYAQEVLLRRMSGPNRQLDPAPIHTDITKLDGRPLRGHVDLICGGFPCQDLSVAGKLAGIDGSRSGLWGEYARLIREIRPRYVLVENVPNLLVLGMHRVLGDVAASGYDAEWSCISAAEMGAPHKRDRVWIIGELADSKGNRLVFYDVNREETEGDGPRTPFGGSKNVADSDSVLRFDVRGPKYKSPQPQISRISIDCNSGRKELADSDEQGPQGYGGLGSERDCPCQRTTWSCSRAHEDERLARSGIRRVSNGIPHRVDRLKSLGNAIVPSIAEFLGHRILEMEKHP